MKPKDPECKGCNNKELCPQRFDSLNKHFGDWITDRYKTCPCTTCLVKMVCVTACGGYDTYWLASRHELPHSNMRSRYSRGSNQWMNVKDVIDK